MRRAYKWVLWTVLGPFVAVLVVGLAWLAFNGPWADAPMRQVPAELEQTALTLAPQDNAFFDMQGLAAPAGEPANAWGQRVWRGDLQTDVAALTLPEGPAWQCHPAREDCVARWRADAPALAAQRAQAPLFGERCHALASRPHYEEAVPRLHAQGGGPLQPQIPQLRPFSTCLKWLQMEAALAPDLPQAQHAWAQADALLRLYASGARTLISHNMTWALMERQQLLLAQWAARQPSDALRDDWLAPLPASLLQPRRWMVAEAAFQRAVILDTHRQMEAMEAQPQRWALTTLGVGWLPQATVQAADTEWLADIAAFGDLQGAALAQALPGGAPAEPSRWPHLKWRNTTGQILLDVARPMRAQYAYRQADVPLFQAALRAVRELNALPAGERDARWVALVPDAGLRERMSLEGDALLVRPRAPQDSRDTLRFPLRPA